MNYWILHKFPADLQRYAECENCGFIYPAGRFDGLKCIEIVCYPYCPICGNKTNEEEYYYEEHDSGYIWDYDEYCTHYGADMRGDAE